MAALGPSLVTIILVLGLTGWERYARVVRAEVLALREKDFVEAARALGVGAARVILRHLLPNTFSSIVVLSTLQVAQAILQEAALSFLGVGSGRTYPTWGTMIALGRDFVSVAWWLATFPGLAILLTVLAINLVGDRLRDALDPRVRCRCGLVDVAHETVLYSGKLQESDQAGRSKGAQAFIRKFDASTYEHGACKNIEQLLESRRQQA